MRGFGVVRPPQGTSYAGHGENLDSYSGHCAAGTAAVTAPPECLPVLTFPVFHTRGLTARRKPVRRPDAGHEYPPVLQEVKTSPSPRGSAAIWHHFAEHEILKAMSNKKVLEVKWIPAIGSALGAVTSAVVLSTLGVGGTLIGAALGSLLITVGGSAYSQSLQRTREHVGSKVLNTRNGTGQRSSGPATSASPTTPPGGATAIPPNPKSKASPQKVFRNLPWKRILGTAAALFAIVMAVILAFELATGRAVSSFTGGSSSNGGGTSIPGFSGIRTDTDTDDSDTEQQQQDQSPTPGHTPSQDQGPTEVDTPPEDQGPTKVDTPQEDQAPTPAQEVPAVPDTPAVPAPEQPAEPKQDPGQ